MHARTRASAFRGTKACSHFNRDKWEMGNFWEMRAEATKTEGSHESFLRAV